MLAYISLCKFDQVGSGKIGRPLWSGMGATRAHRGLQRALTGFLPVGTECRGAIGSGGYQTEAIGAALLHLALYRL